MIEAEKSKNTLKSSILKKQTEEMKEERATKVKKALMKKVMKK